MNDLRLLPSEEERLLAETARDFFCNRSPASRVRDLRANPEGFSWELWREVAELGWAGLVLSEDHGGEGFGLTELCAVVEAAGRTLCPTPLLATTTAGLMLEKCGNDSHRSAWLPQMAAGQTLVTLAHLERGARYDRTCVHTVAEPATGGFSLTGSKVQVEVGSAATAFIVTARTGGEPGERHGISAFIVPADSTGLEVAPQCRIDGRPMALMSLKDVRVAKTALLGEIHQIAGPLSAVLDLATIALSAEMLGGARAALDITLEHLKTRTQFGVVIGAFQALQHRAARLFAETELAASAVRAACATADNASDDSAGRAAVARMASLAKAVTGRAFLHVADEGVQMHGGVGVTDEYDIGLYLKRARAASATLGDEAWHTDRWATLAGY
jgi:alkylation response protein AidB-like acyl-CoA dehydrogenase